MNFGVRLPGPFRIGMSSSGRMNVGATLGPLSASTNLPHRSISAGEVFAPVDLLDALADLAEAGWKVPGRRDDWALVTKGLVALELQAVPGGVVARRVTSRRKVIAVAIAVFAVLVLLSVVF